MTDSEQMFKDGEEVFGSKPKMIQSEISKRLRSHDTWLSVEAADAIDELNQRLADRAREIIRPDDANRWRGMDEVPKADDGDCDGWLPVVVCKGDGLQISVASLRRFPWKGTRIYAWRPANLPPAPKEVTK